MRNRLPVTQSNERLRIQSHRNSVDCTVGRFIGTIIRRESHWQNRVLRNDLRGTWKPRGISSLSGQPAQLRSLTGGSDGTIESSTFYGVISETYWRTRGDSNSR
jgi:hypothetical protein